jgi:Calpain family cysteine protease
VPDGKLRAVDDMLKVLRDEQEKPFNPSRVLWLRINNELPAHQQVKFKAVVLEPCTAPLFASVGPRLEDIRQGTLGTCWLAAAIGVAVATDEDTIKGALVDAGDV